MTFLKNLVGRRCPALVFRFYACVLPVWGNAYVRVNQLGYVSSASKRAYLMASGLETGATFVIVKSGGSTVCGPAAIGANLGSWSSNYPDVYCPRL
jgi:hypothetical protein